MENKIYTIKDLMENEGRVFISIDNGNKYKYEDSNLWYFNKGINGWRSSTIYFNLAVTLEFKLDEKEVIKEKYSGGKTIIKDKYGNILKLGIYGTLEKVAIETKDVEFGENIEIFLEKQDIIKLKESLEEILKLYD